MEHVIEFDRTYVYGNRSERIVCVNYKDRPSVFRIIATHFNDEVIWEYFINEYYLSPSGNASMNNVSLDILIEAWFDSNEDYYWNHP